MRPDRDSYAIAGKGKLRDARTIAGWARYCRGNGRRPGFSGGLYRQPGQVVTGCNRHAGAHVRRT